ncbi:unnamed protein product [Acanthoscelides obtectus]|uniref:Endonuclease/exonuclease/phosphatase domain-containing protein n=1 Tax=Acanthoscelides obtectus TaxID=200917 RepID=A0A9P0KJF9_ACAOB|nr:unnamed protein product [Acanthoscelides obtectus]CAK1656497.1 hypothetical protein AOBTE_LOCUS19751 [Acanthoscelides obtectus]
MTKKKKNKCENETLEPNIQISVSEKSTKETIVKENYYLKQLLEEKERFIYQLVNENRRLQEAYDLISANIVEKESVVSTLAIVTDQLEQLEKRTSENTSYSQMLKQNTPKINSNNKNNNDMKSILVTPERTQHYNDTRKDLTSNINLASIEVKIEKVQLPEQKIAIGIFYRPPHSSVTEAGNTFDNMLPAILAEYDDIILAGDINVNLLLVCNNLTKCLDSYNLKQNGGISYRIL